MLRVREGFNKKRSGKVWSFTTPRGAGGVSEGSEKATLLFWGLKKGQQWQKKHVEKDHMRPRPHWGAQAMWPIYMTIYNACKKWG